MGSGNETITLRGDCTYCTPSRYVIGTSTSLHIVPPPSALYSQDFIQRVGGPGNPPPPPPANVWTLNLMLAHQVSVIHVLSKNSSKFIAREAI